MGEDGGFACAPLPLGGKYRLLAQDRRAGSAGIVSHDFELTAAQPFQEANLDFVPGRTLRIRTLDPEGKPFPGQSVTLTYQNAWSQFNAGELKPSHRSMSERTFSAITDGDGIVEFQHFNDDLPSGWKLSSAPTERLLGESLEIKRNVSEYTTRYRPGVIVTGRVVRSDNDQPVVGKYVYCSFSGPTYETARTLRNSVQTDSEGRFELLLEALPYSLRVFGFQIEALETSDGPVPLEREQVPLRNPPLPEPRRPLPSVKLPFPIRSPLTIKVTPDS